jgi:hypothetical protein
LASPRPFGLAAANRTRRRPIGAPAPLAGRSP